MELRTLPKLRYVTRILRGIRLEELQKMLCKAKERSGKLKLPLLADMLWCAARYGAGYHDYVMFGFYEMDGKHRSTYVTGIRNKKLITYCNDPKTAEFFDHKTKFNSRFSAYLGRDFLCCDTMIMEEFAAFIHDKDAVFAKPDVGESGKGIERLRKEDFASLEEMFRYCKSCHFGILDEAVVQHSTLQRLYPHSVNTLRIVTLLTGAENARQAQCVYAVLKLGAGGKCVDNLENGGLFCPIDQESGEITGVGHTAALTTLTHHPQTGMQLMGYRIPYVKEAIELCKRAAMEEPKMRFVGWDCAITENGPVLIEGNDYSAYYFCQQPEHTPDRIGLWGYYLEQLPELRSIR